MTAAVIVLCIAGLLVGARGADHYITYFGVMRPHARLTALAVVTTLIYGGASIFFFLSALYLALNF